MGIYTIPSGVVDDLRSEKDLVVVGSASVKGGAALSDATSGDTIGLYGTTPTAQQTALATPSASASAAVVDIISYLTTIGLCASA